MIGPEQVAEIVRLHVSEGWRPGTIARHLGVHRETVKGALRRAGVKVNRGNRRSSKIDRFEAFVRETFERYPKVPASVVWRMVTARGYSGSESHLGAALLRAELVTGWVGFSLVLRVLLDYFEMVAAG